MAEKTRYQTRKEQGLCTQCGKAPPNSGVTRCPSCQERERERYLRNRESSVQKMQERYQRRKSEGLCPQCGVPAEKGRTTCTACNRRRVKWHEENRERSNTVSAKRREALRLRVIDAYGGVCACCGERRKEFLTLDHVNGDGKEDRKRFPTQTQFRKWIVDNDFPDHLRILCMNCNLSRGLYGYCPHEQEVQSG